jgi:peptide/nickel transport system permease protein
MTVAEVTPNSMAFQEPAAKGRSSVWRRLAHDRLAMIGLAVVTLVVLAAILAPILPIANPSATDPSNSLAPFGSGSHPFGADKLGRDILSRTIWGARTSLLAGAIATAAAATVGSLVGLLAAFFHGLTDGVLMRIIDVIMAYPYLLLAIALVAFLGPGLGKAMIAIAFVNVPFFARAVRGAALNAVAQDYVEAAGLGGRPRWQVPFAEILPNVTSTILVTISTTIGWMIIETAGLSFLGMGAQPPSSDWGTMLADGRDLLTVSPHIALIPGLAIFVVVMALNFLGDGLRDAFDPRLR